MRNNSGSIQVYGELIVFWIKFAGFPTHTQKPYQHPQKMGMKSKTQTQNQTILEMKPKAKSKFFFNFCIF